LYQYFVNIAPGLKELMAVGKLWDLEQRRVPGKHMPQYDLIIVDTPATGHAVSYLQMPITAAYTAKGFVRREARKVVDLLQDPARTALHIVTTLAEMPVNEAVELWEKATATLHVPVGYLFLNQVYPAFFQGPDLESFSFWKARLAESLAAPGTPNGWEQKELALLACADSWQERRRAQEAHLDRLRNRIKCRIITLPFVPDTGAPLERIQALAQTMEAVMEAEEGSPRAEPGP
jgi:anion-transporting  ArsA/GET3 family ATPase